MKVSEIRLVKKKHEDKNTVLLVAWITQEIKKLSNKRTLCCFPAYNAVNKTQEIINALQRATEKFKETPLDSKEKMLAFLTYREGTNLSIKDALEIKRWKGATPHMYERIEAEIEEFFSHPSSTSSP